MENGELLIQLDEIIRILTSIIKTSKKIFINEKVPNSPFSILKVPPNRPSDKQYHRNNSP